MKGEALYAGMPTRMVSALLIIAMLTLVGCASDQAAEPPMPPQVTPDIWRFGFYQGGDYHDYELHLRGLINGLVTQGLVPALDQERWLTCQTTADMWAFLAESGSGGRVVFVADAFWDAAWDDDLRVERRADCIERLSCGGDIDLIIASGTWAGLDLANNEHAVPTIVISSSDPVRAGITKSVGDLGFDHVHAGYDPDRYERNVRTFYRLVGFERLGLVYENTEVGRIYGNVAVYRDVADELGFELVERHIVESGRTPEETAEDLVEIYRELGPQVDAVITTALNVEEPEFMPGILEPLFEHDVAVWGQIGAAQVRRGALLSIAERHHDDVGAFYAQTIREVMDGAQPGDLNQVYEDPKALAINLETARRIGFDAPTSLIEAADQVYNSIEGD